MNILKSAIVLLTLTSCFGTVKNESADNQKMKEINETFNSLRLKADTAFAFCNENSMNTDFCILIDMKIHSGKNRFFIWDFKNDTVRDSGMCAHGYGGKSTQKVPEFSNVQGSYCSSLGKYKVGIRSYSRWGINVHYKLHGLEKTNDKAFERIVVLHSYDYVQNEEIYPSHLPLGYSQGCPVISNELMTLLDEMLKKQTKPTLLWLYY